MQQPDKPAMLGPTIHCATLTESQWAHAKRSPDARRTSGPSRQVTTPMNSWCCPKPARGECFYDSTVTDLKFGDREIDYDSVADLQHAVM